MRPALARCAVTLALGMAALTVRAAAQEVPQIRSVIEAVSVDVSVIRDGRAVEGLEARDFEVRDDGKRREVQLVVAGEVPLHVLLVIDTSGSVEGGRLDTLRAAALALLRDLGPGDRAGVLSVSEGVRLLGGIHTSPVAARALVARLASGGGTSLRDAIWTALELTEGALGRVLVVLFSDGVDTSSWLGQRSVLAAARESNAVVHVLYTAPEAQVPGPSRPRTADETFLSRVAAETGGRLWAATAEPGSLDLAARRALAEMRSRYVLSFDRPPDTRPGWHRLEVRLKGRSGDVLARRGYFVPGGPPSTTSP